MDAIIGALIGTGIGLTIILAFYLIRWRIEFGNWRFWE